MQQILLLVEVLSYCTDKKIILTILGLEAATKKELKLMLLCLF